MHLSSITIKGFKSFPERTSLVFSPGVSVIVGPNGCGKSNVTDAVLWALGEQSPLSVRGQTMQDMIYAGGEGVGPSRYAEVEVVLDADDSESAEFSEISITRRLERGGEGSYRLNGARARLADVIEILSDANLGREMHSVISQGRVEEIVLSAPRDRRLLVEEAAGLGKHRKRRRRAQLKLERTQDNLDRALDVEREARKSLRPAQAPGRGRRHPRPARARVRRAAGAPAGGRAARARRRGRRPPRRTRSRSREARAELDAKLGEVAERRAAIETELAERESERTEAWGRLTAVRAAHERLTVRAEALAARRGQMVVALDRRRAALGALADELAKATGARGRRRPGRAGLERIGESLAAALEGAGRGARRGDRRRPGAGPRARARGGRARGADRAARRGHARQPPPGLALGADRARGGAAGRARASSARPPPTPATPPASAPPRSSAGCSARPARTRSPSSCAPARARRPSSRRSSAPSASRSPQAEVRLAHLGDRRAEAAAELAKLGATLGRELGPAAEALGDEERAEIEAKLERLARRREQLGPVNPLAEREYEQALEHVESLEAQRTDLETALAELQGLIRETDRKIHAAFEETFEATRTNFEELVEHLFPGGRGRLRLVDDKREPKPVLGGGDRRRRVRRCPACDRPRHPRTRSGGDAGR